MSRRLLQTTALLVVLSGATVACSDDGPDQARPAVGVSPSLTTTDSDTGSDSSAAATPTTPVTPTGTVVDIVALDNQFRPQTVTVKVGDEVKWRNGGRNAHDILSIEGEAWGIKLADFEPGDEYSHIFAEPGEWAYYCTVHGNEKAGMTGTVIVTD